MQIRLLGAHNLESKTSRHTCFLIDGHLAIDAGSLASALSPADQQRVRAILLTHHHFDHMRDVPTMALATLEDPTPIDVYGLAPTLDGVRRHLIDGDTYPDFSKPLNNAKAAKLRLLPVKPGSLHKVLTYEVDAVPMAHPVPSVGYIVRAASGACMAYTGDTSGQLQPFFSSPMGVQVLFVEVTFPNRMLERAKITGHLTTSLLRNELSSAQKAKRPLPRIVAVHRSLPHHQEVLGDLEQLARELSTVSITPGIEDMVLDL